MDPIVIVQNLARALTEMKQQGFLVVGLDSDGADDLAATALSSPLALVLGAEGKGCGKARAQYAIGWQGSIFPA